MRTPFTGPQLQTKSIHLIFGFTLFRSLLILIFSGNRNIHAITSSGNYELLIELEDYQQHVKTAHYTSFSVGNQTSHYALKVGGYNGTAGTLTSFVPLHDNLEFRPGLTQTGLYSQMLDIAGLRKQGTVLSV